MDTLQNLKNKFLKDNLIRKIIRSSGIIIFGNSAASAFNLISFTIVANRLGPTSLGLLVLTQTYVSIVNDIFNVQTWESMVKFGSDETQGSNMQSVIKLNSILDGASAVVAFIFALMLVKPVVYLFHWDASLVTIISLYSLSILFRLTSFTIGLPRLFNRFYALAKIQVVLAILKLFFVLYTLVYAQPLLYYVVVYLGFDILSNLLVIIYSVKLLRDNVGPDWWRKTLHINRNQALFIWWSNLRTIIRIPVRYLDMIIISSVMSMKMVGIYKVYKEIAGMMDKVSDPINVAIFPEFSKLIGKNSIGKTLSTAKKSIILLGCASAAITLFLLAISKFAIGMIFGPEYLEHIRALYLILILYGISFVLVPINSLFLAAGFAKYSFYIVLTTNTIYLFTAFLLGKAIGIYGIVAAYGVQMVLNQGSKVFLMKKHATGWSDTIR